MAAKELSDPQKKVLRTVARSSEPRGPQLSGNGQAGAIAAAKALVRKGLLQTFGSSCYTLTDVGRPIAEALLAEYRAEKDAQNLAKKQVAP